VTSTLIVQIVLLGLLAVVVAYVVPLLIQIRRTARAVEELVRDAGPRLTGAVTNLDSVLGRTDRVLEGLENGTRGISGAVTGVGSLLGMLKSTGKGVSRGPAALAGLLSILAAAWKASSARGKAARPADGQEAAPPDEPLESPQEEA